MRALQYIEIDIDFCSLTYGVGACPAVLGVDSPIKCFNTLATCPPTVINSFDNVPKTLRFVVPTQPLPATPDAIPSIKSISFDSPTVSLGQNLGSRASITVTFEDHPHSDTGGLDKYLADRPYNPFDQGTFWGKFRARVPYLRGRPLRWLNGALEQSFASYETRHYIIESFSGPTNNGEYVLIAKDVLKLADDDRALAPATSLGFLTADITSADATLTLSPAGIESTYPHNGYVNIGGSEIAGYTHQLGFVAGSQPNAVTFDGVNDYYRRVGGLTGAADSKLFTISGWIRSHSATFGQRIFVSSTTLAGSTQGTRFVLSAVDGVFNFNGMNAANTVICTMNANQGPFLEIWEHFLLSVDLTDPTKRHFYVNDVNVFASAPTYTNDTMDFTMADWAIGAIPDGTSKLNADLAELWVAPGVYIDFSVEANRRLFVTADLRPVPLGATGQLPTGTAPRVFCNAAGNSWGTNVGTGGTFTLTGATPAATFNDGALLHIGRGQLNTVASDHKAGDRVQWVLQFVSRDPASIIYELLVTYAGIPASYCPLTTWQDETANFLNRLYNADIAQPTGVNKLVSELIEQAGLVLWWDDVAQEIGFQVLRGAVTEADALTLDNVLADSVAISEQPDKRLSSIHTYFGLINPLMTLTDPQSFRSMAALTDTQAETFYGSPAIKEIFARWIPANGRTTADRINTIVLSRFTDPPRHFALKVMRDIPITMGLAQVYDLSAWPIQDATGAAAVASIQLTRVKPMADVIEVEGDEMLFTVPAEDLGTRTIIIDSNTLNFNAKTTHDLLYPAAVSGDAVSIIINAGVIVGSSSTTLRAFDVGTWPAGVTITLTVNGRIEGTGGKGGYGANFLGSGIPGTPGDPGGIALYTRKAITLIDATGEIWGGGGGGGGAGAPASGFTSGGGGGGAGYIPGSGSPGYQTDNTYSFYGASGTTETGGAADPNPFLVGGNGGGPGLAGQNQFYAGGAAGTAIDGISFITTSGGAGDRRGPQIN